MNTRPMGGLFDNLTQLLDVRSARASSWDQEGRNQDYWLIPPNKSIVLADIEGPGCITHIWMTQFCRRVLGPRDYRPLYGSLCRANLRDSQCPRLELGGFRSRLLSQNPAKDLLGRSGTCQCVGTLGGLLRNRPQHSSQLSVFALHRNS